MSVYKGTTLLAGIATNTKYNANNLLDFKWTDYLLNDQSWLRADTFSWQDGTVYSDAYDHLVVDYNGGTSTTETVGSYTITYVLATDGHKITTDETTVANIYNESGVSWYYILDTANTRFKLPRTKFGFTGLRDTVGKYVPESLPNIKGQLDNVLGRNVNGTGWNGAFSQIGAGNTYPTVTTSSNNYGTKAVLFSAADSSSIYQDNAPVQQRSTQMYLYFYVGQYSQTATEQTAGLNTELFNGKADRSLTNLTSQAGAGLNSVGVRTVVETYISGTEWYRVWSDGWIEQGGRITPHSGDQWRTRTLLKAFSNTNYIVVTSARQLNQNAAANYGQIYTGTYTTTGFNYKGWYNDNNNTAIEWYACGY